VVELDVEERGFRTVLELRLGVAVAQQLAREVTLRVQQRRMKSIQHVSMGEALLDCWRQRRVGAARVEHEAEIDALGLESRGEVIELCQRLRREPSVRAEQDARSIEITQPNGVDAELTKMPRQGQRRLALGQTCDTGQVHAEEAQATAAIIDEMTERSAHEAVRTSGLGVQDDRSVSSRRSSSVDGAGMNSCGCGALYTPCGKFCCTRQPSSKTAEEITPVKAATEIALLARRRLWFGKRPISARISCTIMLEFRSFVGCLTGLVLGLTLAPSVALAANKDKAARQLQTEAMQTDYAETNFKKSEQKLKKAIKECGGSNCSNQVVGSCIATWRRFISRA
jgi:hypothetical protein